MRINIITHNKLTQPLLCKSVDQMLVNLHSRLQSSTQELRVNQFVSLTQPSSYCTAMAFNVTTLCLALVNSTHLCVNSMPLIGWFIINPISVMKPNILHYVLTLEHSVAYGGHFIPRTGIKAVIISYVHTAFLTYSITNTLHPEIKHLLFCMLLNWCFHGTKFKQSGFLMSLNACAHYVVRFH